MDNVFWFIDNTIMAFEGAVIDFYDALTVTGSVLNMYIHVTICNTVKPNCTVGFEQS